MQGRWGEIPLMAASLCFMLGIAASRIIAQYCFACLAIAALASIAAAILSFKQSQDRLALALILSVIALCGCLLALVQRDGYFETDERFFIRKGVFPFDDALQFDACVVEEGKRQGDEVMATVDLRAIYEKNEKWAPCRGKASIRWPANSSDGGSNMDNVLKHGDRVRGWATWRPPRNYQNPNSLDSVALLKHRGIFLTGRVKSARLLEVIPGDCSSFWTKEAAAVRQRMRQSLNGLIAQKKEKEAAILASIVVGDYSYLDGETREAFQNSGTYHVLVVSGLHVAWIFWVLLSAFHLLRIPQEIGRLLSALGILFYTCVVGFQASISRCLWMLILYLIGQILFRKAKATNILLACAFLLLTAHPDWLFDIGFQLSFLSAAAISLTALPMIERFLLPCLNPLCHTGNPERLFIEPGKLHQAGRKLRLKCELWAEACADCGEAIRRSIRRQNSPTLPWASNVMEKDSQSPSAFIRYLPIVMGKVAKTASGYAFAWGARCIPFLSRNVGKAGFVMGSMGMVSISVQLWLEMLLAYHFNRLSWISPLANLIIVPLSSLALAAGLISALTSGIPIISGLVIEIAAQLASLLLAAASQMSSIPGMWQRCPTPYLPWVISGILLFGGWCFFGWKRTWIPSLFIILSLACLSYGSVPGKNIVITISQKVVPNKQEWSNSAQLLDMTFLDVGEGDAIAIWFPNGRLWLVDSGGIRKSASQEDNRSSFDIGEAVISRYLWWAWITRLDRLVLSHPDQDHAGGMLALLRNFRVTEFNYSGIETDAMLPQILAAARKTGAKVDRLSTGQHCIEGGVDIQVLNPPPASARRSTNEDSMVLALSYGRFSALLTGDLEKAGEAELLSREQHIRSLLLKVAHHGSKFATLDPLLDRVAPRWGIVSAGRNNPFGHPSRDVLLRLLRRGIRPLLTLDQGAISVRTDGRRYRIISHVGGMLESGTLP